MRLLAGSLLAAALLLAPAGDAQAQDHTTFDDATALMWGVGTLELSLTVTSALIAGGDTCQSWGCAILLLLGTSGGVILGVALASIAAATEAPSDAPFVVHHALWAGATTFALSAIGWTPNSGTMEERDFNPAPGLIAGSVIGVGMGTYTFVRRDEMLRDPDLAGYTHFLTWVPPAAGLLTALIVSEAVGSDYQWMMILGGLVALASYTTGIVLIETNRN